MFSPPSVVIRSPSPKQMWKPPLPFVKLNSDVSWNSRSKCGGLGVVVRNHEGNPIIAVSDMVSCGSAIEGKVLALRLGLLECISKDVRFVLAETDCKDLGNFLNDLPKAPPLLVQGILQDIRFILKEFSSCIFSYISREFNVIADSLAQKAMYETCRTMWPLSTLWMKDLCNPSSCSTRINE
ncbi:uncharacterized protein LOC122078011 [Macadamia integrifolia]|uniref:uncharacterized protein LOC122078011 n=1 Tax=Macadamia integrifolia TaxID=60698 RepID=UPI001C500503|nr:uncharacterized protein LOC122078011 [Macadamia integrifolia]